MNELVKAIRRSRAVKISPPIVSVYRSKRENLIRISLKFQGLTESQIQDIIDQARDMETAPEEEPRPLLHHIVSACCEYYGINRNDFMSHRRMGPLSKIRQVAFYLAKTMTPRTMADIGRFMNKDRSNVEHGYKLICDKLRDDDQLLNDVENLEKKIKQFLYDQQEKIRGTEG